MQKNKDKIPQTTMHLEFLKSEVFNFTFKILCNQQSYFACNICFMNTHGAAVLKSMQTSQKSFRIVWMKLSQ